MTTNGKYRGTVLDNHDPLQLGRVRVSVPDVSSESLGWALPCVPYAPPNSTVPVPPLGASVWVEFEDGDATLPVWSGCFWNVGDDGPRFEPA